MAEGGPQQGVRYWLLKHGGFTVTAGIGVFFLLAFGLIKVTGFRQHQAPADSGAGLAVSSQAAVVAGSQSAAPAQPSPSVEPTDLPQFDQPGSGSACTMTYAPDTGAAGGGTVTVFNLAKAGELVAHVSGTGGTVRHDAHEDAGPVVFSYDTRLGQITDMGAVLYLADGTQQSCAIGPAGGR